MSLETNTSDHDRNLDERIEAYQSSSCILRILEKRKLTALDFEIAASKDHWSELQQSFSVAQNPNGGEEGKAHLTNSEIVLHRSAGAVSQNGRFLSRRC